MTSDLKTRVEKVLRRVPEGAYLVPNEALIKDLYAENQRLDFELKNQIVWRSSDNQSLVKKIADIGEEKERLEQENAALQVHRDKLAKTLEGIKDFDKELGGCLCGRSESCEYCRPSPRSRCIQEMAAIALASEGADPRQIIMELRGYTIADDAWAIEVMKNLMKTLAAKGGE